MASAGSGKSGGKGGKKSGGGGKKVTMKDVLEQPKKGFKPDF